MRQHGHSKYLRHVKLFQPRHRHRAQHRMCTEGNVTDFFSNSAPEKHLPIRHTHRVRVPYRDLASAFSVLGDCLRVDQKTRRPTARPHPSFGPPKLLAPFASRATPKNAKAAAASTTDRCRCSSHASRIVASFESRGNPHASSKLRSRPGPKTHALRIGLRA